jgi:antitoxin HicB
MADNHYRIVIEPLSEEDGGGFLATVPELPGCMSDGETDVEALENAHDAITCWIEEATRLGRQIPKPKHQRIYA